MFVALLPFAIYPMVADTLPWLVFMVAFLGPIITLAILAFRYPDPLIWTIPLFKSSWRWGSISLVALGLSLFANGALDRSPASNVYVTVVSKEVSPGRNGDSYFITVAPSWRAGKTQEKLDVGGGAYARIDEGETVAITLHKGRLGLPWYSLVVPR